MNRYLIIATWIGVVLVSCTKPKVVHIGDIVMQEASVDTVVALCNDANSPMCTISLHMLYATGKGSGNINNSLLNANLLPAEYFSGLNDIAISALPQRFAQEYINAYRKENKALFVNDSQNATRYNQSMHINTTAKCKRKDMLTYEITTVSSQGEHDAHKQTKVLTIDMKSGRVLTLDDLMLHGYENHLKEVISRKLTNKFHCDNITKLATKYNVLPDKEIYIPQNFIVEQDCLTIIYNEDEIAPHDIGEIRLNIDRNDLGQLLKN